MNAIEMTPKDLSLVPMRMSLGATMLYHGIAKLRGERARQAAGFFQELGLRPGRTWSGLAGVAEVLAGATAILGLGTRIGALAVLATQAVAVAKVHRGKGFDNTAGGYEFNILLSAVALGLLLAGPGTASVHEVVEHRVSRGARDLLARRRRKALLVAKLLE